MGLVSILFNIATWLFLPLWFIFLSFDGIVYSLVAYSYKLFELMTQLNFNTLYLWFYPIISRVTALITVLIIFVIGYNLVLYLINPDKAADKTTGGVAMVKNIAIAAVLLISYNFIFTVINEATFLLVGAPEGYEYSALFDTFGVENTPGDKGLISRLVFGADDEEDKDFGKSLAINTLGIFLHGKPEYYNMDDPSASDDSEIGKIYKDIDKGTSSFDMMAVVGAATHVADDVEYHFPILSTAVGAYLIYTIVTIAIAVGVRALKMVFLQILAPIAIVTIIKDGATKSNKVWSKYIEVLGKTFIDVFIRVAAMFFTVGFISQAWGKIGDLFSNSTDAEGITRFFLLILIVIAGFKFAKELPKMIDDLFGSHLAENNKNGLGQFLGAAGGAVLGAAGGALIGGISGAKNSDRGFKNRLKGALGGIGSGLGTGLGKGLQAGWKTKGDSISEVFKAGKGVAESAAQSGAIGLGGYIAGSLDARQERRSSREREDLEKIETMRNAVLASKGNIAAKTSVGASYTYRTKDEHGNITSQTSSMTFKKMDLSKDMETARTAELAVNADYQEAVRAREMALNANDSSGAALAEERMNAIKTAYATEYDAQVREALNGDTKYSEMATTYGKNYHADISRDETSDGRAPKTAEQIRDELIGKSKTTINDRKARISLGSTRRTITRHDAPGGGKQGGGNK